VEAELRGGFPNPPPQNKKKKKDPSCPGAGEATGSVAVGQNLVGSTYTYLLAFEAPSRTRRQTPQRYLTTRICSRYLATNAQAGSSKNSDADF